MLKNTIAFGLGLTAAALAGCADVEPSPRGHSMFRPIVLVSAMPPEAVLQGEGGPVEVTVTNAGFIPVRVIDVEAETPLDDGGPFESEKAQDGPRLEPGESAKAVAIARPLEAGDQVSRKFRVTYDAGATAPPPAAADGAVKAPGAPAPRKREVEVKMKVMPAEPPLEDARSKARVGSQAQGVHSASLGLWAFERPDGLVVVPPDGEAAAWPGISLRAFAWADVFVGNVPVRFANEKAFGELSKQVKLVDHAEQPGENAIADGALGDFLAKAAAGGFMVDGAIEGKRRLLVVR